MALFEVDFQQTLNFCYLLLDLSFEVSPHVAQKLLVLVKEHFIDLIYRLSQIKVLRVAVFNQMTF